MTGVKALELAARQGRPRRPPAPARVSQAIGALEGALRLRLFDRVGRGTVLTERGQRLLERVASYQAGLQAVITDLTDPHDGLRRGVARLGVFIGFSHARMNEFLAEFLARYPLANVKVLFLPHAELAVRLVERKLDAALSIHPLDRQARVLESKRLFEQELILVSGRKLYVANPSLRQIRQLPIVDYYESGELTRTWIKHHYRADPGALRIRAHVGTVDFVLELIVKNVGVGVVPRDVAAPLLASGVLRQIKTKRRELSDSVWLNQIRGFPHEPIPGLLIEELNAAFAGPVHSTLA